MRESKQLHISILGCRKSPFRMITTNEYYCPRSLYPPLRGSQNKYFRLLIQFTHIVTLTLNKRKQSVFENFKKRQFCHSDILSKTAITVEVFFKLCDILRILSSGFLYERMFARVPVSQ